jgi:hypothetical protein
MYLMSDYSKTTANITRRKLKYKYSLTLIVLLYRCFILKIYVILKQIHQIPAFQRNRYFGFDISHHTVSVQAVLIQRSNSHFSAADPEAFAPGFADRLSD